MDTLSPRSSGERQATGYAGPASLKFGTSGLRGLAVDLLGLSSRAYALAFVRQELAKFPPHSFGQVLVGRDLRSSSPRISSDCAAAIEFSGLAAVDCGEIATPALALEAQRRGCPAIMVTGSHIPDDRNGLKFYRPDGEITKGDEAEISVCLAALTEAEIAALGTAPMRQAETDDGVANRYIERYVGFFGAGQLRGLRVGVYQHSSVARDVLVELLAALGAEAVPFGRAASFIPVDTEAHDPAQVTLIREAAKAGTFDAIISSDGDADRPLMADAAGNILRGDVLGLLTARYLSFDTIVTPVTSGAVVERSGLADKVIRTRIGSPYVIEAMTKACQAGARQVLGFEANGGTLLGTDIIHRERLLSALPTRDAVLPILATLSLMAESGKPLDILIDEMNVGFVFADRLKDVPSNLSAGFLQRLALDRDFASSHFSEVGSIASVDCLDGVRVGLADGSIIHYRASGNAPELRCYVEAGGSARGEYLLAWGLEAARSSLCLSNGMSVQLSPGAANMP